MKKTNVKPNKTALKIKIFAVIAITCIMSTTTMAFGMTVYDAKADVNSKLQYMRIGQQLFEAYKQTNLGEIKKILQEEANQMFSDVYKGQFKSIRIESTKDLADVLKGLKRKIPCASGTFTPAPASSTGNNGLPSFSGTGTTGTTGTTSGQANPCTDSEIPGIGDLRASMQVAKSIETLAQISSGKKPVNELANVFTTIYGNVEDVPESGQASVILKTSARVLATSGQRRQIMRELLKQLDDLEVEMKDASKSPLEQQQIQQKLNVLQFRYQLLDGEANSDIAEMMAADTAARGARLADQIKLDVKNQKEAQTMMGYQRQTPLGRNLNSILRSQPIMENDNVER